MSEHGETFNSVNKEFYGYNTISFDMLIFVSQKLFCMLEKECESSEPKN